MPVMNARGRVASWVVLFSVVSAVGVSLTSLQAESQAAADGSRPSSQAVAQEGDGLMADMTIRQWRIGADGARLGGDPPALTMRLARERHGQGWRTAISLRALDRPSILALGGPIQPDNPFVVSRLEYDDDGSAPRLYDGSGRLMNGPTGADRRILGLPVEMRDPNWDPSAVLGRVDGPARGGDRPVGNGLLVRVLDRQQRRGDIERRFGARSGRVRGLDQFVRRSGSEVRELLMDVDSALPTEVSVTVAGQFVSRAQFDYQPFGRDDLLRHHTRAERAASAETRSVTDVTIENVSLTGRGAK